MGLGAEVFGLSTQTTDYQLEMAERMHLPFEVLSDADFSFCDALDLPTFEVDGVRLIKQVLETGVPLEFERNGRRLRVAADAPTKLDRLVPHPDAIVGDPEDLVHGDWSSEWHYDPD